MWLWPCREFRRQNGFELCIDLHHLSANEARVAVRCALGDLRSCGEQSGRTAVVLVGKGLGSELNRNPEAQVGP